MSFTEAFFVFRSKRVIRQQIELLMRVSFLDKKTFKITALQGCALTVPGGIWHLTGLLPHNKKILVFSQKSSQVQPARAFGFFGSSFQFHPPRKTRNLSRKKRILSQATGSAEHWTLLHSSQITALHRKCSIPSTSKGKNSPPSYLRPPPTNTPTNILRQPENML